MSIEVLESDKVFYDSPGAGEAGCTCSRCGSQIPDQEEPVIRAWPSEPDDHGYDPKAIGGTEFRYCIACCESMGIVFIGKSPFGIYDDDDDWDEPGPSLLAHCRICGCTEYDACIHKEHGACHWVEKDLCSHCKNHPGEATRFSKLPENL